MDISIFNDEKFAVYCMGVFVMTCIMTKSHNAGKGVFCTLRVKHVACASPFKDVRLRGK